MAWTKLSDDFSDDCWELSDAAFRLHVEGLVWSNRKLLDGRLDKADLRRWAKRPEAVEELVACGWWEDRGDHYQIIHHACYQRTREQVLAQQERNQKNGQRGGRPKGPPREQAPRKRAEETQSQTHTETQVGYADNESGSPETHTETQVGNPVANPQGRDGPGQEGAGYQQGYGTNGEVPENGSASVKVVLCHDCRVKPTVRSSGEEQPYDDPMLCRDCNNISLADSVAPDDDQGWP